MITVEPETKVLGEDTFKYMIMFSMSSDLKNILGIEQFNAMLGD